MSGRHTRKQRRAFKARRKRLGKLSHKRAVRRRKLRRGARRTAARRRRRRRR